MYLIVPNSDKSVDVLDLATHGSRQNKPVESSASLLAENQALREKLEKQTYRRKVSTNVSKCYV